MDPTTADRTTPTTPGSARLAELGDWEPSAQRIDPLELIAADEDGRLLDLLPLRHQRMAESGFAFFRATASVQAADMAAMPRTSLVAQLSGDAHLSNFGLFRAPDRALVFDLNDFDETLPGPVEWDLRRLAASVALVARHHDVSAADHLGAQHAVASAYCEGLAEFAEMHHVELWYHRLTPKGIEAHWGDGTPGHMRKRLKETVSKARTKDRLKAFKKLTEDDGAGSRRFRRDLENLTPIDRLDGLEPERARQLFATALESYRETLSGDRQMLLDQYRFVDLARRVGGVGSVGTRCWLALLVGSSPDDPLFLQIKEAGPSVLEAHLGAAPYREPGQRVVEGQRRIQSSTDVFLGWEQLLDVDGLEHDYYFRQLWDGKGTLDPETITPEGLVLLSQLCAHTLARAHARTGDADELADFFDDADTLTTALATYADRYADQVEADHRRFVARREG
jgi:uncharacterized protein (DUF2252 family)